MARGKHAASAAKRRAESAEDQLDRLLPKLHEAQTLAKRYKSEAERVPALCAELAKLRTTVGVPIADHQAEIDAERERYEIEALTTYQAFDDVLFKLADLLKPRLDVESRWLSTLLLNGLRALPADRGRKILEALGCNRDDARLYLRPGTAAACSTGNVPQVAAMGMAALQAGYTLNTVPREWVDNFNAAGTQKS